MSDLLFKVLRDGRSCNGGDLAWSLPQRRDDEWTPGEWHEVGGDLDPCSHGLHLTVEPARWWFPGVTVYIAEAGGEIVEHEDKRVCRRARLLREASTGELVAARVFLDGSHEIIDGRGVASGSASVRAYGSASVVASGSASVRAYDSASVVASDSASVVASGSASVRAYDSASVVAYGRVTVVSWRGSVAVRLEGPVAVHVDRSGGRPVVTVGDES